MLKILDQNLEELYATKAELEYNLKEALTMYPEDQLLIDWRQSYQQTFKINEDLIVCGRERNENDDEVICKKREIGESSLMANQQTQEIVATEATNEENVHTALIWPADTQYWKDIAQSNEIDDAFANATNQLQNTDLVDQATTVIENVIGDIHMTDVGEEEENNSETEKVQENEQRRKEEESEKRRKKEEKEMEERLEKERREKESEERREKERKEKEIEERIQKEKIEREVEEIRKRENEEKKKRENEERIQKEKMEREDEEKKKRENEERMLKEKKERETEEIRKKEKEAEELKEKEKRESEERRKNEEGKDSKEDGGEKKEDEQGSSEMPSFSLNIPEIDTPKKPKKDEQKQKGPLVIRFTKKDLVECHGKPKRTEKIGDQLKSPYIQRKVDPTKNTTVAELKVGNWIFALQGDKL